MRESLCLYQMLLFFFSELGDGYSYGYGGEGSVCHDRCYDHSKRGMKKMFSRQRAEANDILAELNEDAKIEHLKENEVKRHKAQLKATH